MSALPTDPHAAVCRRVPSCARPVTFADLSGPEPAPEVVVVPYVAAPAGETTPVPDDVRRAAMGFARAIVEGLGGRRSPAQFGDLVSARVVSVIAARARADRQLPAYVPASVRVQFLAPAAAEVTLRLVRDGRSAAAAFRLDRRRGAWRCTALVVGP